MTDQDDQAPKSRSRKPRRSAQESVVGTSSVGEPQLPNVRVSTVTMKLFAVGGDGDGGESDGEEPIAAGGSADKLSGKNPRWLASQGKQRQADSVRERIQHLTESIEAEEAKPEPALKKSWLLAKRQELRKIVLKQPDDIIEGEGFVGKVERKLAAARDSCAKSAKKEKGKRRAKSQKSNSDDSENEIDKDDASAEEPEDGKDAPDTDEETQTGDRHAESSSGGAGPSDNSVDHEADEEEQLPRRRVAKQKKSVDTGDQSSQNEQAIPEGQKNGKSNKKINKKREEAESDKESAASDQSDTEAAQEEAKSAKDAEGKKGKFTEKEKEKEKDKMKDKDATKDKKEKGKEKKKEKEKKGEHEEEKDKPDKKGKGKEKVKKSQKGDESDAERSESENESAKSKWKRPLKKMEAVIKLPSRKKRVEKIARGGSTADRQDDDSVDGSGSGGDSLWGERIDTPKDAAARPKRRLSVNSHDRPPSSDNEDDAAVAIQVTAFVLEIDAAAALSDDDGVDEVKLKELPTSGKRHDRQKQKKKADAQSARKGSGAIEDIPVLQESVKQKLRDKFSIKRKPKRSAGGAEDGAGDNPGDGDKDGKGSKKEKDKKKQKEKAKEKPGSKLDEFDGNAKKANKASSKSARPVVDISDDSGGPGPRTWRGPSAAVATPRSPIQCRIDDTLHCISLDD